MEKRGWFTTPIIIGVIIVLSYVYLTQDGKKTESNQYVELSTDIGHTTMSWHRGPEDLPCATTTIRYTVQNQGNILADDVSISCVLDGEIVEEMERDIQSTSYYEGQTSFELQYDTSTTVMITATYQTQTSADSVSLNTDFPRYNTELASFFITPDDPIIEDLRDRIVKWAPVHWMALRTWVGNNVDYEYDSTQFGEREYWLFGRETYDFKEGDCEDQAILLCSLLRADGWDSDEVYVILGTVDGEGHAWVSLKILDILGYPVWINLEPTAGGIISTQFADLGSLLSDILGDTEKAHRFNDEVYEEIE